MPVRVGLKHIEIWNSNLENDVRKYEEEPIEKGQIVFYGPSNFTRWSAKWKHIPLRDSLPGKSGKPCAINRGFGSSCAEHQLYYYPRMVRPLEPKVLVYFPFGNYTAFGYSVEETWELAQRVITYALTDFPDIHVYICNSLHTRDEFADRAARALKCNELLREFVNNTPNCYYVDMYNHEPLACKDIFVDDGIHYNQKGYDLYTEFFKEVLREELDRY